MRLCPGQTVTRALQPHWHSTSLPTQPLPTYLIRHTLSSCDMNQPDSYLGLSPHLKLEFEYDTRGSWATGLEYRRQSAAGAAGAQHQVEHGGGLAEERAGEEANRIGEIGVVQRVERLNAKLQGASFLDDKFPAQSQIELRHSEAGECVSSQLALPR